MPFYVPLGPRGLIFRLGTLLVGVPAAWIYWRDSRRRILRPVPLTLPVVVPGRGADH